LPQQEAGNGCSEKEKRDLEFIFYCSLITGNRKYNFFCSDLALNFATIAWISAAISLANKEILDLPYLANWPSGQ
jgi:hypothetical protein